MNQFNKYSKIGFNKFLTNIGVEKSIINKANTLPNQIKHNETNYNIYIAITEFQKEENIFDYQINYYSEEIDEFLLKLKVFQNPEISINFVLNELNRINE